MKRLIALLLTGAISASAQAAPKYRFLVDGRPNTRTGEHLILMTSIDEDGGRQLDPVFKFWKCTAKPPVTLDSRNYPVMTGCKPLGNTTTGYANGVLLARIQEVDTATPGLKDWTLNSAAFGISVTAVTMLLFEIGDALHGRFDSPLGYVSDLGLAGFTGGVVLGAGGAMAGTILNRDEWNDQAAQISATTEAMTSAGEALKPDFKRTVILDPSDHSLPDRVYDLEKLLLGSAPIKP
jgi:hypothetical protein